MSYHCPPVILICAHLSSYKEKEILSKPKRKGWVFAYSVSDHISVWRFSSSVRFGDKPFTVCVEFHLATSTLAEIDCALRPGNLHSLWKLWDEKGKAWIKYKSLNKSSGRASSGEFTCSPCDCGNFLQGPLFFLLKTCTIGFSVRPRCTCTGHIIIIWYILFKNTAKWNSVIHPAVQDYKLEFHVMSLK